MPGPQNGTDKEEREREGDRERDRPLELRETGIAAENEREAGALRWSIEGVVWGGGKQCPFVVRR